MSNIDPTVGTAGINHDERLRLALIALSILASEAIEKAQLANLDKTRVEEIHRQFDVLKAHVRDLHFDWDQASATTVEGFRTPINECRAVRLRVQIAAVDKAVQIEFNEESEPDLMALLANSPEDNRAAVVKTLRINVSVMGETGESEELLPIVDRQLVELINKERLSTSWFEVLGIVVTPPEIEGRKGKSVIVKPYRILAIDIRPLKRALQLVAPTPGELQAVDQHYRLLQNPLKYITDKVTEFLGVHGLDRLPIIKEALEFQALAAVTEGQRASTCLVGPPGVGKSLIGKAAKLLQPISHEAMPTKVTEAGLIGVGSGSSKQDARRAGLLPQSNQGGFIVQDWHQANSAKNQRLNATLATVMQDGVVYDSSASRCSYTAQVSVIIDANRISDVKRTTQKGNVDGLDQFVADTKLPTNIITRLTYIAEIPRSVEDQIHTLKSILRSSGENREQIQSTMASEMRYIKVWLARLRDVHREVTISNDVAQHMNGMIQQAINICQSRLAQRAEYGDFMIRLAEQAVMLTKAHARLHNRGFAIVADVDGIFPYLHRKMAFIRSLLFGADTAAADVKASAPGRQTLIKLRLKPGCHTPKQVLRHLCLTSCSEEAIAGDLLALFGQPDGDGRYAVPA